jgi:DNA-directed RNA polymerase subunit N (RpoN/RPB10)
MLIPIRCHNCGKVIADTWRYYQRELAKIKGKDVEKRFYMDGTSVPDTPERKILDEMAMNHLCCRSKYLTQKDLMDKI